MNFTELFCKLDDCSKEFARSEQVKIEYSNGRRGIAASMSLGEIMTIIVGYHASGFKTFKQYYLYLQTYHRHDFPKLLSYSRFIEWIPYCLIPLTKIMSTLCADATGIGFIDSTSLSVCDNIRIRRNKTFAGLAERGKSSMGWFYGFKLHIVINSKCEIMAFRITKGNTNDRSPVKDLLKDIKGKIFGDRGYLSKSLFEELYANGTQLITNIKNNMKNKLLTLEDKYLLRKRFIIETIFDLLKNGGDIDHSRHRSPTNCFVHLIAGLISYTLNPNKPQLKLSKHAPALA